jgi:hypothetical protein
VSRMQQKIHTRPYADGAYQWQSVEPTLRKLQATGTKRL